MAVESRQQSQLHGLAYGYTTPQFSNPWGNSQSVSSPTYANPQVSTALDHQPPLQSRNLTLPPYSGVPVTTGLGSTNALLAQAPYHHPNVTQAQYPQYTTATTGYQQVTAPGYINLPDNRATGFAFASTDNRKPSHHQHPFDTSSHGEVVDASRQILSLSQSDMTPTPRMYQNQQSSSRSSPESYGFPAQHSPHSSISSASGVHSNYGSSVGDYSLTDYSSAGESVDLNHQRTLPRPVNTLHGGMPPAPQSMMGQFSSKISSNTQKKHKCKICDKRFTRPSSLQTHIYSHTGEKPFACEVEGCGRHFSVVSNLRRHKKVHKSAGSHRDLSPDEA